MANQSHPILAPVALRYDLPANEIGDMELSDCRNCTLQDGLRIKRPGFPRLGSNLPLSGACTGGVYYQLYSGTKQLVMGSIEDLYRFNTTSEKWEIITPSETAEACDEGWLAGSGDTLAHDATDKMIGSAALKLTLGAARSENDCLAYKDIDSLDISDHNSIGFWVKVSTALSAGDLKVLVSESNHAAGERTGTYVETDITALAAGIWTFVRVAKTLTDYDAVLSVSLYAGASVDSGLVVHLDDVRAYTPLTGDDNDFLEADMLREVTDNDVTLGLTNNADEMLRWSGTGAATALITEWPAGVTSLLAMQILQFKDHWHLFAVTENGNPYPTRVRWGNTAKLGDFINGNASYQDLRGGDWIKRAVLMSADHVAVLKAHSIWVGYATGGTDIFKYEQQVPGLGTMAGRTAVSINGNVYFLGWDDVYRYEGITWEKIGGGIRAELFRGLNVAEIERAFAVVHEAQNEYWLCVPYAKSTYCNTVFVYNYALEKWTARHEFADDLVAAAWYQSQNIITIGDLQGTIGDQTWRFGDMLGTQDAPVVVFMDADGRMYPYNHLAFTDDADGDETPIDGWFTSKDFMFTALKGRQVIIGLDIYHEPPSTMTVEYSIDKGVTWTGSAELTAVSGEQPSQTWWNVDCRLIRFRIRHNSAAGRFAFREARINWRSAGTRMI